MKLRCPYCKQVFGPEPYSICPHCGKAMAIPGGLRKTTFLERKKALERIAREAERKRKALRIPNFKFGRKPSSIFLILVIMVIVGGMLIGGVNLRFPSRGNRNPEAIAARELNNLRIALEHFRQDCGRYPETSEGLKTLINNPGIPEWNGPYVNLIKPDPWKQHYRYNLDNGKVILFSCGPDRIQRTNDDLTPETADFAPL